MVERSNGIKMLRIEQVTEKVGYKESTIYDWMNSRSSRYKSHFPLPRKNGRSNRWYESEIDDFCIREFGASNNRSQISSSSAIPSAGVNQVVPLDKAQITAVVPSAKKIIKANELKPNLSILQIEGTRPEVTDSMPDKQDYGLTSRTSPRKSSSPGKAKATLTRKIDGVDKTSVIRTVVQKRRTFVK